MNIVVKMSRIRSIGAAAARISAEATSKHPTRVSYRQARVLTHALVGKRDLAHALWRGPQDDGNGYSNAGAVDLSARRYRIAPMRDSLPHSIPIESSPSTVRIGSTSGHLVMSPPMEAFGRGATRIVSGCHGSNAWYGAPRSTLTKTALS